MNRRDFIRSSVVAAGCALFGFALPTKKIVGCHLVLDMEDNSAYAKLGYEVHYNDGSSRMTTKFKEHDLDLDPLFQNWYNYKHRWMIMPENEMTNFSHLTRKVTRVL